MKSKKEARENLVALLQFEREVRLHGDEDGVVAQLVLRDEAGEQFAQFEAALLVVLLQILRVFVLRGQTSTLRLQQFLHNQCPQ